MSKVIFVRGYPGAGKTTFANKLVEDTPNKYRIVDPDITDANLITDDILLLKQSKYKINLKQCLNSLDQGYDVLWTQAWRDINGLEITIENIKKLFLNPVEFLVIEICVNPKISWLRIKHKFKDYSEGDYIEKFVKGHQKFNLKNVKYLSINANS